MLSAPRQISVLTRDPDIHGGSAPHGISTYVNGAPMNPVQIDTSTTATDTIDYVATDQTGLTSTSTRQVIIEKLPTLNRPHRRRLDIPSNF